MRLSRRMQNNLLFFHHVFYFRVKEMKKIETNKMQKKSTLFSTAFRLFTDKGFAKTTIADIVTEAGLAKGTFYLYFKDKYDLRDKLIVRKACQLIAQAQAFVDTGPSMAFEERLLSIVDYILDEFSKDPALLQFIAKNLSWGVFRDVYAAPFSEEEDLDFYEYFLEELKKAGYTCSQPELLLYTIMELVGSTSYSCILYSQPVPIDIYLPYLHRSIKEIIRVFTSGKTGGE